MKTKVSQSVEQIFAHAVSLEQSGRFRNTIFAIDNEVFIMNYDHTVLIRFALRKSEAPFSRSVSFSANDYDSNVFWEEDGKIVFETSQDGFVRRKSCKVPDMEPADVRELFNRYWKERTFHYSMGKSVLSLLEADLSHIEFSGKAGEPPIMVQRNIYSGGVIELQEEAHAGLGLLGRKMDTLDFDPIAIKTNDLFALYAFQEVLEFSFPTDEGGDFILVRSQDQRRRDMRAVVACCLYDEVVELREVKHGRKEQKIRRRK